MTFVSEDRLQCNITRDTEKTQTVANNKDPADKTFQCANKVMRKVFDLYTIILFYRKVRYITNVRWRHILTTPGVHVKLCNTDI